MPSPTCEPASGDLDALRLSDWNFAEVKVERGLHTIHPYPAKFIPQIPRQLLRLLKPPGDSVIFDPFCGSGTTLVEAQIAGYRSVGIDLNPIATLVARVKTRPPERAVYSIARELVRQARRLRPTIPPIPNLDHWFAKDVQGALAALRQSISEIEDERVSDALSVAVSRIIVRVSNQDGETRYAAVKKQTSAKLTYELFLRAAADLDRAYAETFSGLFTEPRPECRVINRDVLKIQPGQIGFKVGLVITSPPYPNAYEYWLYHKYRMYWLGFDPIEVRQSEIGARPHYFKKNHQTEDDFRSQMEQVFGLLNAVMLPGALACFVIGRSIIHGREIDNTAILEKAAGSHGFWRLLSVERVIPATRKSFNPSHGAINRESLVIFGR